jgi:hypothetical protein
MPERAPKDSPGTESKNPSSNIQIPEKHQRPDIKWHARLLQWAIRFKVFGAW